MISQPSLVSMGGEVEYIAGWKTKPEESDYYHATSADRWKFGAAYLGLAAFLALMGFGLHSFLGGLPHPVA